MTSRLRWVIAVAVIGLLFLVGSTIWSNLNRDTAQIETQQATEQRDSAKQQADAAAGQLTATAEQARQFAASVKKACDEKTLTGPVCQEATQIATAPPPGRVGPSGKSGRDGKDGADGKDGRDGSPAQRQIFTGLGGAVYDCTRSGGGDTAPIYACVPVGGSSTGSGPTGWPGGRSSVPPPVRGWPRMPPHTTAPIEPPVDSPPP